MGKLIDSRVCRENNIFKQPSQNAILQQLQHTNPSNCERAATCSGAKDKHTPSCCYLQNKLIAKHPAILTLRKSLTLIITSLTNKGKKRFTYSNKLSYSWLDGRSRLKSQRVIQDTWSQVRKLSITLGLSLQTRFSAVILL